MLNLFNIASDFLYKMTVGTSFCQTRNNLKYTALKTAEKNAGN